MFEMQEISLDFLNVFIGSPFFIFVKFLLLKDKCLCPQDCVCKCFGTCMLFLYLLHHGPRAPHPTPPPPRRHLSSGACITFLCPIHPPFPIVIRKYTICKAHSHGFTSTHNDSSRPRSLCLWHDRATLLGQQAAGEAILTIHTEDPVHLHPPHAS